MAPKRKLMEYVNELNDPERRGQLLADLMELETGAAAVGEAAALELARAEVARRADSAEKQLSAALVEIGKLRAEFSIRPLIEYGVRKFFKDKPQKPTSLTAQVQSILDAQVFEPYDWVFQSWVQSFLDELPGKTPKVTSSRFAELIYAIYGHLSEPHHLLPEDDDGDDDEAGFHIRHPQARMRCAMALTVAALQRAHALDSDIPIFFHANEEKCLLKQGQVQKLNEYRTSSHAVGSALIQLYLFV